MDSEEDEEDQMEEKVSESQPAKSEQSSSKSDDEISDNSMDLSYVEPSERDLGSNLMDEGDTLTVRPNPINQRKWDNPYSYLLVRPGDELKVVGRPLDLSIPPYAPNQLNGCKPVTINVNKTPKTVKNNERSEKIENNLAKANGLPKADKTDSEDNNISLGSRRNEQETASSEADGLLKPTRTESDDSESIALGSENQELLAENVLTSPNVLNPIVEGQPENNVHQMQRYAENNLYQQEPAGNPLNNVVPSISEISAGSLGMVRSNPGSQTTTTSPNAMKTDCPNQQSMLPCRIAMKNGQGGKNVGQNKEEEGEASFNEILFDLNLHDGDMGQQKGVESKKSSDENKSPTPESKSEKSPHDSSAGINSQAGECDLLPFGINSILSHCHRLQLSAIIGENKTSSTPTSAETINNILLENGEPTCNGSVSKCTISTSELEAGLINCSSTSSEHIERNQTDEKELQNGSGGSKEPKTNDTTSLTSDLRPDFADDPQLEEKELPNGSEHQDLSESKISLKDEQDKEECSMNEMEVADKDLLKDLNQMEDTGCLNLQNSAANVIKSLEIKQDVVQTNQLSSEVADVKVNSSSPIQKGLLQRYSLDEELGSKDGADLKQNDYQLKQEAIENCARSMSPRMKPTLDDLTHGFKKTGMLSKPKAEQNGGQQKDQTSLESSYLLETFEPKSEENIKKLTQIQTKKRKLTENVVANLKQIKTLPGLEETTMIKSVSTVAASMNALSLNMLENAPSTSKAGLGLKNGEISGISQNQAYGHLHSFSNTLEKNRETCPLQDSLETSSSGTLGNPDTKKTFELSTADSLGSLLSKEVSSAAHTLATLSRTFSNLSGEPVESRPSSTQSQNSSTTSSACIVSLTSRQEIPLKRKLSEELGIPNDQVPCPKMQKIDVNKGTNKTPTSRIIQNHPTSGAKAKIQRSTSLGHMVAPLISLNAFTMGFQSQDSLSSKNGKKHSKNHSKKIGS